MKFVPARKDGFFLDDLFDDMFSSPRFMQQGGIMKTDVHEKDGKYSLDIELPGFKKEDISISLFNGNLTVSAEHNTNNEEKDDKGNIIRQERFNGKYSRSFYVGDGINESDISAKYENGELSIVVPSIEKKEEETKKLISIQ